MVSADTRTSPQAAKAGAAQAPAPTAQKPDAVAPPTALADGDKPPGAKTVTIIDGTTGKRQEVTVAPPGSAPRTKAGAAAKAETKPDAPIDQRLLETSRHGAIPKIAPDGARPSEIYSRPGQAAGRPRRPAARRDRDRGPRHRGEQHLRGAREDSRAGHLSRSRPTAPISSAGSRARAARAMRCCCRSAWSRSTIRTMIPARRRCSTSLLGGAEHRSPALVPQSRFQGYVGVTSLMGARFTATDQALAPGAARDRQARPDLFRQRHLAAQRRRPGLRRAERGLRQGRCRCSTRCRPPPRSTVRSRASRRPRAAAASRSAPRARCRSRSTALSQWIKTADARGITLVPISAVANRAKSAS